MCVGASRAVDRTSCRAHMEGESVATRSAPPHFFDVWLPPPRGYSLYEKCEGHTMWLQAVHAKVCARAIRHAAPGEVVV